MKLGSNVCWTSPNPSRGFCKFAGVLRPDLRSGSVSTHYPLGLALVSFAVAWLPLLPTLDIHFLAFGRLCIGFYLFYLLEPDVRNFEFEKAAETSLEIALVVATDPSSCI